MTIDEIDFLITCFGKITDAQEYELPSDFAERVRYLPKELTPFPGKFSFSRHPYFKKIVDLFHPMNPAREIVLMKGNQMGSNTDGRVEPGSYLPGAPTDPDVPN